MGGAGASANSGNNRPKWMQPPSREQQRRTQRRNRIIMFVVVAAIFIYLIIDSANWGKQAEQFEQPQDYVSASAPSGEALSAAKNLRETEPTNGVGYRRQDFGFTDDGWPDLDGDDCNERNEILARDLAGTTFWEGGKNPPHCVVGTGVLHDPYSGREVDFDRAADPDAVQIDHVVALYDAWQKGADDWQPAKRFAFATDPLNLLAVSEAENDDKGHQDASQWLPSNENFRCEYVARQVGVKQKYDVGVSAAEKQAMVSVLEACPTQELPAH